MKRIVLPVEQIRSKGPEMGLCDIRNDTTFIYKLRINIVRAIEI